MHNKSQHHSINTQHDGQCEDRKGEGGSQQEGGEKHKEISNNYPQNCLELITGRHYWEGENAIGLVSKQILFFHTTPTPTGCLLPRY